MAENINIRIGVDASGANQTVGELKNNLQGVNDAQEKVNNNSNKFNQNLKNTSTNIKNLGLENASRGIERLGSGFTNLKLSNITSGFRMLGAAIAANPIGAIATAVLALINAFGGLQVVMDAITSVAKSLFGGIMSLFGATNDLVDANAEAKKSVDDLKIAFDRLDESRAKLQRRYTDEEKALKNQIELLKARGATQKEIDEAEKKLTETIIQNKGTQIANEKQALFDMIELRQDLRNITDAQIQFEIKQAIDRKTRLITDEKERTAAQLDLEKKYSEQWNKVLDARRDYNQTRIDAEIETERKKTDKLKQEGKKVVDNTKQNLEKELALLKEAEKAKIVVTESGSTARFEAEMNSINTIERFIVDNATKLGITQNGITILLAENIEKRKKLEEDYYAYVNKLSNSQVQAITLTSMLKNSSLKDEERIQKEVSNNIVTLDNSTFKSRADQRREDIRGLSEVAEKTSMYAQQSADVVMGLANVIFENKKRNLEKGSEEEQKLAKKQFQFGKAVQLSLAIVDGFKAITTSLANSPVAFGPVPNPAGIASLAFAAATSAINIAKIAAQKFQPTPSAVTTTSAPTPSIGGAPTTETPTFTPTSFFGLGQTTQFNPQEQGPTRVYVTEGDISNTQNRVRVVENRARFG